MGDRPQQVAFRYPETSRGWGRWRHAVLASLILVWVGVFEESRAVASEAVAFEHVLFEAVRAGDLDGMRAVLVGGGSPDVRDESGDPAILVAASLGHLSIVDLLLRRQADPDLRGRWRYTALMTAASAGHPSVLRRLLDAGADLEAREHSYSNSALHIAARRGRDSTGEILVGAGAEVDARNALSCAGASTQRPVSGK
ncbi:MAG: ankyrin repeat domain-containing protein [Thermoanaerobaculia bacterium]|nr:ankyrin repeat domain-containing protein [Thermoanaerobaculia bacterium]